MSVAGRMVTRILTLTVGAALAISGCGANGAAASPSGSASASAFPFVSPSATATSERTASPAVMLAPDASTHATEADGDFQLDLDLDKLVWRADESITGKATLTNTSAESIWIYGSGAGPFAFNYAEAGGTRKVEGAWPADCGPIQAAAPAAPMSTVLTMTGGHQPDDPNDAWKQLLFTQRVLPAGVWDVTALANFSDGEMCNGRGYMLQATVRIQVTNEGAASLPTPTFPSGAEAQPGPGQVVVVGDPPTASRQFVIQFEGTDGTVFGIPTTIVGGQTVIASTFDLPGSVRVRVDGVPCDGVANVQSDMTTTVALSFPSGGCAIAEQSVKPSS